MHNSRLGYFLILLYLLLHLTYIDGSTTMIMDESSTANLFNTFSSLSNSQTQNADSTASAPSSDNNVVSNSMDTTTMIMHGSLGTSLFDASTSLSNSQTQNADSTASAPSSDNNVVSNSMDTTTMIMHGSLGTNLFDASTSLSNSQTQNAESTTAAPSSGDNGISNSMETTTVNMLGSSETIPFNTYSSLSNSEFSNTESRSTDSSSTGITNNPPTSFSSTSTTATTTNSPVAPIRSIANLTYEFDINSTELLQQGSNQNRTLLENITTIIKPLFNLPDFTIQVYRITVRRKSRLRAIDFNQMLADIEFRSARGDCGRDCIDQSVSKTIPNITFYLPMENGTLVSVQPVSILKLEDPPTPPRGKPGDSPPGKAAQIGMGLGISFLVLLLIGEVAFLYWKRGKAKPNRQNEYRLSAQDHYEQAK